MKTPTKKPHGQQAPLRVAEPASNSDKAAADMQELSTLRAERDLLKKSLEARETDQTHALQSIRRSQDFAAKAQGLQRALEQSERRVAELEGRCLDLEQTMRVLIAERDEFHRREQSLLASSTEARTHFQERVEQLGQSLATLQRLRQTGTPENEAV